MEVGAYGAVLTIKFLLALMAEALQMEICQPAFFEGIGDFRTKFLQKIL